MKYLLLVVLCALPLFGTQAGFVYASYDDPEDQWCDEYWENCHYYDHHWVYYPHGYYCVYYVWWHPWYWDWYWYRCHWCHHWDWDFFCAGYYVVWYEDGGWWWRPRYGRPVRYKLPYAYHDFRWKARAYGVNLPDKPGRTIEMPYREAEIQRLMKQRDPDLFKRVEQEQKSGNLEKIRQEYDTRVKREIAVKNEEYQRSHNNQKGDAFVPARDDQASRRREDIKDTDRGRAVNDDEHDRVVVPDRRDDQKREDDRDRDVIRGEREQNQQRDEDRETDGSNRKPRTPDRKSRTGLNREVDSDREGSRQTSRSVKSGR